MTEEKTEEQETQEEEMPLMKAIFGGRNENILIGIFCIGLVLFFTNALLISFGKIDAEPFKYLVGLGGLIMMGVLVVFPFLLYRRMSGKY